MSDQDWILFLLIVVLYAVFAGWLGRFSVTMPMVLVVAGALTGPDVLGLIDIPTSAAGVERVAEVTLSLLLFADAAALDLGRLRHHAGLAGRLLLIGLPLTVMLGACGHLPCIPPWVSGSRSWLRQFSPRAMPPWRCRRLATATFRCGFSGCFVLRAG